MMMNILLIVALGTIGATFVIAADAKDRKALGKLAPRKLKAFKTGKLHYTKGAN